MGAVLWMRERERERESSSREIFSFIAILEQA
jgi:hypothetical protein